MTPDSKVHLSLSAEHDRTAPTSGIPGVFDTTQPRVQVDEEMSVFELVMPDSGVALLPTQSEIVVGNLSVIYSDANFNTASSATIVEVSRNLHLRVSDALGNLIEEIHLTGISSEREVDFIHSALEARKKLAELLINPEKDQYGSWQTIATPSAREIGEIGIPLDNGTPLIHQRVLSSYAVAEVIEDAMASGGEVRFKNSENPQKFLEAYRQNVDVVQVYRDALEAERILFEQRPYIQITDLPKNVNGSHVAEEEKGETPETGETQQELIEESSEEVAQDDRDTFGAGIYSEEDKQEEAKEVSPAELKENRAKATVFHSDKREFETNDFEAPDDCIRWIDLRLPNAKADNTEAIEYLAQQIGLDSETILSCANDDAEVNIIDNGSYLYIKQPYCEYEERAHSPRGVGPVAMKNVHFILHDQYIITLRGEGAAPIEKTKKRISEGTTEEIEGIDSVFFEVASHMLTANDKVLDKLARKTKENVKQLSTEQTASLATLRLMKGARVDMLDVQDLYDSKDKIRSAIARHLKVNGSELSKHTAAEQWERSCERARGKISKVQSRLDEYRSEIRHLAAKGGIIFAGLTVAAFTVSEIVQGFNNWIQLSTAGQVGAAAISALATTAFVLTGGGKMTRRLVKEYFLKKKVDEDEETLDFVKPSANVSAPEETDGEAPEDQEEEQASITAATPEAATESVTDQGNYQEVVIPADSPGDSATGG